MSKLVRKIGLVAHDAMKKDLIEWVLWNSERLIGHKFYCTGTTGTLIREALKEKQEVLSRLTPCFFTASLLISSASRRLSTLWIR